MKIHIFRPDLLGARLLNLAYGSALAELCDCRFALHWPLFNKFSGQSGYGKGDNLHDLFDSARLAESSTFAHGVLPGEVFERPAAWGGDLIELVKMARREGAAFGVDQLVANGRDLIFSHVEPLEIAGIDRRRWHSLARERLLGLPEREEIKIAEENLAHCFPRGRLAAIHLRRGDVVSDVIAQSPEAVDANLHLKAISNFLMRFVPFSVYKSYLVEHGFEGVLLFSDEKGISERCGFRDILPVVDVTNLVQQLPLKKIQRDLVEVRLMARADVLLASQSRFPQLAAVYSGRVATDLSRRGHVDLFMEELYRDYGLTSHHAIHAPLEEALRRTLFW